MSGQQPDEDDDEQEEEEEEEEEDRNLFVANAQHVVFDDEDVENESAEEHSMLAPSSLAASSEDGSQFADDDYEDTATAHDEVRMASLAIHPVPVVDLAHTTLLIPNVSHPIAFTCGTTRRELAPGACNHPHRGDFKHPRQLGGKH